MNDNDGPWVTMEEIGLHSRANGQLLVTGKIGIELEDAGDVIASISITASVRVLGDESLRAIERALLENAVRALGATAAAGPDQLEAWLRSTREEQAQFARAAGGPE